MIIMTRREAFERFVEILDQVIDAELARYDPETARLMRRELVEWREARVAEIEQRVLAMQMLH